MSRRERDVRDSHSKRLHSRFDREPSPKKLKRDEKPEVNMAHSSHRNSSSKEAAGHEQKERSMKVDVPLKAPPASSTLGPQNEKKILERKDNKLPVRTQHSSDNREAPRSRSYYQHDERSIAGQGGRNFNRRETEHRKWDDLREQPMKDLPKKDERPQSHPDEKTSIWRHDRFHELESGAPTLKKRPAFREKKVPVEPETDTAATGSDKPKLPTSEPPDLAATKREERGGFYPRADDRRERRADGLYHREIQRNAGQSRERYGAMRGRGDRSNVVRYGTRDSNRAGGFEVDKWKHDLFDEANRSPPRKNEEEQIAKVEALLAS
ncbi:uncharacterized protein LOC110021361 [Phalaenopsis equestris]|uniref:uncharacterized protein LOC110021361 n=1 Tax=Phalaenopsis equestris TaxID=78828 RepID=UPI0009E5548D|nr:uncharacterized protein LOC110021361 [Phalaenopsis equestris]